MITIPLFTDYFFSLGKAADYLCIAVTAKSDFNPADALHIIIIKNIYISFSVGLHYSFIRNTKNILFICGGAFDGLDKIIEKRMNKKTMGFGADIVSNTERDVGEIFENVQQHDLLKFGIIPELAGRLPVIASLDSLNRDDLVRILTEPKNSMTRQYKALMSFDDVELEFEPQALEAVADKAIEMKIGARGLRSVMEGIMTDIMYTVPSDSSIKKVIVTAASVRGECGPEIIRE